MKALIFISAVLLAGCSKHPEAYAWKPPVVSERESVVESVQQMSVADIEKEAEPYRSWLIAQRSGFCGFHRETMYRQWIPIAYGLPVAGSIPSAEEAKAFPYGEDYWPGGCMVTAAKEKEVFLCSKCVVAYHLWRDTNDRQASHKKSLEVTPTAVTPPADASGAPSAGVPHH